jgi:phosphatidate cytidylyltransferase
MLPLMNLTSVNVDLVKRQSKLSPQQWFNVCVWSSTNLFIINTSKAKMLKQRVITALIMLAIVIPTLLYPNAWPFCLLALLFMAIGAWEWARMNGLKESGSIFFAGFFMLVAGVIWYLGLLSVTMRNVWIIASGFWVLCSAWLLLAGVVCWSKIPVGLRLAAGLAALWVAWLAVCQARMQSVNFLMSVLCLVWAADTFAYFAGKTWGGKFSKNKLAPTISPGKSWEGVWGGVVGVFLLAFTWIWADSHWLNSGQIAMTSLYTRLNSQHLVLIVVALLFLTAMSVVGDLIESLIKRSAGVKDSSGFLPGHGGVLDRVDALLPTLPIAMMLASLVN